VAWHWRIMRRQKDKRGESAMGYNIANAAGRDDLLDWLTWPANLLLAVGAVVANWFVSEDAPGFAVIQMMVATLVLAAVVSLIVYLQSLTDFFRSRWKAPHS
jgi:membrane protein YdbS with pleckstrin-like domain